MFFCTACFLCIWPRNPAHLGWRRGLLVACSQNKNGKVDRIYSHYHVITNTYTQHWPPTCGILYHPGIVSSECVPALGRTQPVGQNETWEIIWKKKNTVRFMLFAFKTSYKVTVKKTAYQYNNGYKITVQWNTINIKISKMFSHIYGQLIIISKDANII